MMMRCGRLESLRNIDRHCLHGRVQVKSRPVSRRLPLGHLWTLATGDVQGSETHLCHAGTVSHPFQASEPHTVRVLLKREDQFVRQATWWGAAEWLDEA